MIKVHVNETPILINENYIKKIQKYRFNRPGLQVYLTELFFDGKIGEFEKLTVDEPFEYFERIFDIKTAFNLLGLAKHVKYDTSTEDMGSKDNGSSETTS